MSAEIVVAILALLFTVSSFWWLHARQGRLITSKPHSYALSASDGAVLLLRLPLVLYNTGPKPIVIQNLRVWFVGQNDVLPLPWRTSRSQLKPASDDGHSMPAAFPVNGREATQVFVEFGGPFPGFHIGVGTYPLRLEAVLAHKRGWKSILEFDLRVKMVEHLDQYISYDNTPDWPDRRVQKATEKKARELLAKLEASAKSRVENAEEEQ